MHNPHRVKSADSGFGHERTTSSNAPSLFRTSGYLMHRGRLCAESPPQAKKPASRAAPSMPGWPCDLTSTALRIAENAYQHPTFIDDTGEAVRRHDFHDIFNAIFCPNTSTASGIRRGPTAGRHGRRHGRRKPLKPFDDKPTASPSPARPARRLLRSLHRCAAGPLGRIEDRFVEPGRLRRRSQPDHRPAVGLHQLHRRRRTGRRRTSPPTTSSRHSRAGVDQRRRRRRDDRHNVAGIGYVGVNADRLKLTGGPVERRTGLHLRQRRPASRPRQPSPRGHGRKRRIGRNRQVVPGTGFEWR